jgi:Uma2 family endonuclease
MSYKEYLAWHGEEGNTGEWIEGEVIPFVPPGLRHQAVLGFLHVLLHVFVEQGKLGRLIVAPFEMWLPKLNRSREPDLLFLSAEHADRLDAQRLEGPADLVVEILSPESTVRDRRDKLAEYAAAGIPEYWIVDPRPGRESFELLTLTDEGYFALIPASSSGRISSKKLAGLEIDPAWIRQDPLPDPVALASATGARPRSRRGAKSSAARS